MAANDPPDQVVVRFNLSLGEVVPRRFASLTVAQQRRQRSEPFERHGMHWLLTVEKLPPSNGGNGFDIQVHLFCLSVESVVVDEAARANFPLKGEIPVHQVAQDGQARSYNAQEGRCCNLVGKRFPANAVYMPEFILQLKSGMTVSNEVEVSMMGRDELGGYYGGDWHGVGGLLLENHEFDAVRDGAAIEVTLRFLGKPYEVEILVDDPAIGSPKQKCKKGNAATAKPSKSNTRYGLMGGEDDSEDDSEDKADNAKEAESDDFANGLRASRSGGKQNQSVRRSGSKKSQSVMKKPKLTIVSNEALPSHVSTQNRLFGASNSRQPQWSTSAAKEVKPSVQTNTKQKPFSLSRAPNDTGNRGKTCTLFVAMAFCCHHLISSGVCS